MSNSLKLKDTFPNTFAGTMHTNDFSDTWIEGDAMLPKRQKIDPNKRKST
jgi:hypothetical protein